MLPETLVLDRNRRVNHMAGNLIVIDPYTVLDGLEPLKLHITACFWIGFLGIKDGSVTHVDVVKADLIVRVDITQDIHRQHASDDTACDDAHHDQSGNHTADIGKGTANDPADGMLFA